MSELPSRRIYAPLTGRNILVGLTGSSAIYKSIDLVRTLIRMGANVKVVMSREATRFLGSDLVEWAIGEKPYVEESGRAEHIMLSDWADIMVIAPATLNTMARIAYGLSDQLIHLTAVSMIGLGKKVVFVPAMNTRLYYSKQYRDVSEKLSRTENIVIIPPLIEEGKAKYPPINDLAHCIDAIVNRGRDLEGKKILVTAGPTIEHIDPVRVITNMSSGLMGVLIAREAFCRGASVKLVHGPLRVEPPYGVEKYSVNSTIEMARMISKITNEERFDAAIFAAAPSDFMVIARSSRKISTREERGLVIKLKPTPKTIRYVSKINRPGKIVIFVAETVSDHDELVKKAMDKLKDYNADIAIANNVSYGGIGFSSEYIDACIVFKNETFKCYGVVFKELIAREIIDLIKP
jgi:phosphopantothenoylcysteine decarboxylase/phosphopantothenate--cysteine ligase